MRTIAHLSDLHFGRIDHALLEPLRRALERLQPHVEALSEAEGLQGHARALEARLLDRGRRAP